MASKGLSETARPTSSSNPYVSHEERASKYMKDHRIIELFENMMAGLVYERPENPKEYMKKHLQQLLKAKADPEEVEAPCLLDESNLKSMITCWTSLRRATSPKNSTSKQWVL